MTKILCIDFDGVLHSYTSPWEGAGVIKDGPVPGAIEWLKSLVVNDEFDPQIYSSRSKESEGIEAMKGWLVGHGLSEDEVEALKFPTQKPSAFLTIDDRAHAFLGSFPSLDQMKAFKPWNKKKIAGQTTLGVSLRVNGAEVGMTEVRLGEEIRSPEALSFLFEGILKKVSVNLGKTPQKPSEEPAEESV
jgi:hypothetical protein